MAQPADVIRVDTEDEYVHVRFRDPDDFEAVRTPDWAQRVAETISPGAEVRTGRLTNRVDWAIQSVLIERPVGEVDARRLARDVVVKVQS